MPVAPLAPLIFSGLYPFIANMNDVANADLKIVHGFYISPVIVQGTDGKLFYWFFSSLKADIPALEILTVLAEEGYQLPIYPDPISTVSFIE